MAVKRTASVADLSAVGAPYKHVSSESLLLELPVELLFKILNSEGEKLEFARLFGRLRRTCRFLRDLFGSPAEIERAKRFAAIVHEEVFAETIHHTTRLPSGVFHGRCWREWRTNRQLASECTYRDDVKVGVSREFARDGQVISIERRDNQGLYHGVQMDYSRLHSAYFYHTRRHGVLHGPSRTYHDDRLVDYCSYADGVKHGTHRSWLREFRYGRLIVFLHETYRRGVLHGERRWHWTTANGHMIIGSVQMRRGKEHGLLVERFAKTNGVVLSVRFCNGKIVGNQREHVQHDDGLYHIISPYVRGVLHGVRKYIKENQTAAAREELYRRGVLVSDTFMLEDDMRVTTFYNQYGGLSAQTLTRGSQRTPLFHQQFSGSGRLTVLRSGKHKWS